MYGTLDRIGKILYKSHNVREELDYLARIEVWQLLVLLIQFSFAEELVIKWLGEGSVVGLIFLEFS